MAVVTGPGSDPGSVRRARPRLLLLLQPGALRGCPPHKQGREAERHGLLLLKPTCNAVTLITLGRLQFHSQRTFR